MFTMMTDDPVWDAERWEHEKERMGYARRRPFCVVCDERINDAHCYVMDPVDKEGSCICESCMKGQLEKMAQANINVLLREWIAEQVEYVSECWQTTPYLED